MASLNSLYIWDKCIVFNLTKNLRLLTNKMSEDELKDVKEFSEWILKVGDGKIAEPNDGEALIEIPKEFLITNSTDPIDSISKEIYGDLKLLEEDKDPDFYQTRAILCPTNEDVHIISQYMLDQLKG